MSTEYRHPIAKQFLDYLRTYPSLRCLILRAHYQMAILNPNPTDKEFINMRILFLTGVRKKA